MTRPILARIHASALTHNLAVLRARSGQAGLMAVVKANAYGHGLVAVAASLAGADAWAVLDVAAATRLRELGHRQPILLLEGAFSPDELPLCAELELAATVHSEQQIAWLRTARLSRPLQVFLKLNSGMNRLGFALAEARQRYAELAALPNVAGITLMTHFATADEPERRVDWQFARFQAATAGLDAPFTAANSAALFDYPATHGRWVRPGLVLYGASPFAGRSARELGLLPAMSLNSAIISVQQLQAGDAVGYGASFVAEQPLRVGTVACGYADGYPRHAPTGTPVLVDGVRTRLIGRVSMDMLAVDLEPVPQAGVGSAVELWGQALPIDEVARAAGTISYELMCALAPRVPLRID
ncbi:alanine racemase [Chitinilyticum litopenaei]|uniref:alanine racemase n=1 Tax=Chitinilyticum litopenaei TaxID=1121276 RepID=UPI000420D1C9|nr:alanine racemase [Chitinilyticum litopenaei]